VDECKPLAGGGAPEAENQPPQIKQEVDLASGSTMTIHSLGRAVHVDPMKPTMKSHGAKRLKLKCYILL